MALLKKRGSDRVVCESCEEATTPWTRFRGLLGRGELPVGEGIYIAPAPSVHTFWMRFPIDVVFVDRDLCVVSVRERLRPWRVASCRRAHAVIELPAGEAQARGLGRGDLLELSEAVA